MILALMFPPLSGSDDGQAYAIPAYPWSEREATGDYFFDNYTDVPQNSVFQLVTSERLTDILSSNGTYYIAFASPGQATGQNLLPLIQARAQAQGVSKVYVYDPYVDGYQIDVTAADPTSPAQAWLGGNNSASLGADGQYGTDGNWTPRPADVWTILKHFLPAAASVTDGVLDGFSGQDAALLKVQISDRTAENIQDGRSLLAGVRLDAEETWADVSAAKSAQIDALINTGAVAAGVRSDWDFFKRIYNGMCNYQSSSQATQGFKDAGGIFRETDFPGGEGFALRLIDIKEAYNLLNSPGEFPIFFASAACHNTTAIIRQVALTAKDNGIPTVYVVDPLLDNHLRFGTGASVDTVVKTQNVSGTYLRNNATENAYKFSYLYGELVKYFDPGFVTENESKRGTTIAYFPNGLVPDSGTEGISVSPFDTGTADGYAVLGDGQTRHAKRLQAPTLIRYNKDVQNPVTAYWLHSDPDPLTGKSTSPLNTYTEYMLEINYVEQPADYTSGTSLTNYKAPGANGGASVQLSRYEIGNEAKAALANVLPAPEDPPAPEEPPAPEDPPEVDTPPAATERVNLVDAPTGIKIEADPGVLPASASIAAVKLTSGASYDLAKKALKNLTGKFLPYDISILDSAQQKIQPDGKVLVSLPIPADYNKARTAVYYIADNGNASLIPSAVVGDYVTFRADHFSLYVLAELTSDGRSPQTGDDTDHTGLIVWTALMAAAAIAGSALIFVGRRKLNKKRNET
jgi:hypothetical protein